MLERQKQRVGLNGKFSKDHHDLKSIYKIIDPKYSLAIQQRNLSVPSESSLNTSIHY